MRKLVEMSVFLFLFVVASWADSGAISGKTAYIYTLRPRELVLSVETNNVSSFMSLGEGVEVAGYFKMDEASLLWIFDSLRKHLLVTVDPSQFSIREYKLDDVLFNFYQYYLQIVPFYNGSTKMVYINAYRHDYNEDESPAKDFVWVFDGGAHFWSIVYNMETNVFFEMDINGSS